MDALPLRSLVVGGLKCGGQVTDRQIAAIYASGGARGLTAGQVETVCQHQYACRPDALSKVEATAFIDYLRALPTPKGGM